ncbi:MAG: efflux RND transporter periplasmic adaptor subunit [Methylococcaceae bacterium]|nr:MAG: efflux RND transporter periplasmic adaptor subunit [Methylococcaceae bacterium]
MNQAKIGGILALLAVVNGFGISAGRSEQLTAPPAPNPALSVNVVHPTLRSLPLTLAANGSVSAWQEAVIGAEIDGLRLAEVAVQVGDAVKKGQVLALFAEETVLADVAQSRAALAEAEANLADARLNAKRAQEVAGSGALSAQQVAQYLTGEKTAQARMQSAKAQLDAQWLRRRHTRVVAGDDGVIASRSATLGAVATTGQELFRLIRQNRLEWRAEVSAAELAALKPGLAVSVAVPGFPRVEGTVRTVAPTVDAQTRNALVYVDLPGAAAQGLRPGMFGHGEFHLGASAGLSVPQQALSLREGFSYVFRLGEVRGGLAQVSQVKVQAGRRFDDQVEILTGLSPEDKLVSSGGAFLTDGDTVRVVGK